MNVKALLFIIMVGIVMIVIAAAISGITYFVIRAAFKRNQYEYEEMFKRLKARIAGQSYSKYGSMSRPDKLVVDLDEAINCIDRISKEYEVGRITKID